jgi:hypothetical protein
MAELIIEEIDLALMESEIIEVQEGMAKVKNFYIKGPFLQSEVMNGNKRIYPRAIIEKEVAAHINTKIKENRALGELGHPPSSEINLDRVSHLIKELSMNGNTAIGKAQILDTPCGKIAKSLMESGVKLGVSSRGVGSLKNGVVQQDYRLICVDIVSDPSGPGCWVDGITEGKEWVMVDGILSEQDIEKTKKDIDTIVIENKFSIEDRQAAFLKLFKDNLEKINAKIK